APARAADWRERVTLTLSERVRGEYADWFRPPTGAAPTGAARYAFFASRLRAGVRVTLPHVQLVLQGQDTRVTNLPDDATLAPPVGALGPGALYFLHTRRTTQGEPFLKLGFLGFRRSGLAVTAGRFEYADGLETEPPNPTLAFLKRARIAERLVGPFGFTHVTRSFDGGRVAYDRPDWNLTAIGVRPTRGGFEVSANGELDVALAGLALTLKRLPSAPPADARLFYLYYQDDRDAPVKVDTRPLGARAADRDAIAIHTAGGHLVSAIDLPPGTIDTLLWGVVQAGEWGTLDHAAWAWAAEVGYQLPRVSWTPWLRTGWNQSSGDRDPGDRRHGTFFQLLPTPRTYAQLPFYNLMNTSDVFGQLLLTPHRRLRIRVDHHWLTLTERRDLWYAGGGAGNDDVFGFSGAPSGGHRGLAQVTDVSIGLDLTHQLVLNVYYGHAFGARAVRTTFAGADADYGFTELVFTF
ncbi:MAG TPA: alginate export family protein, partial [Candidatus Binatia bacterium]|nr:alginate export family protein [Candidatus Binatia bacterium]